MKVGLARSSCGCGDSSCNSPHNHAHDGEVKDEANINFDWLEFYNHLFKFIHNVQPKTNISGTFLKGAKDTIATNATAQFRGQINSLTVYDQHNKPRRFTHGTEPQIPMNPKRVVIHMGNIDVEYNSSSGENTPVIEARGFRKHDVSASHLPSPKANTQKENEPLVRESYAYMTERAEAAFAMVYLAKMAGHTSINFANTSDPIARAMLIQACKHLEVDFGKETIMTSSVGTTIDPMPKGFPMAQAFGDKVKEILNERGARITEEQQLETLSERVLMLYIKHPEKKPDERLEHFNCGHKPKYNQGDYPLPKVA